MKKIALLCLLSLLGALGCQKKNTTVDFSKITQTYFEGKNRLNPLDATVNGQSKFNDQLQFEMTEGYRKAQQEFYTQTKTQLADVDYESLTAEEKISYDIIQWEIAVGEELLKHPTHYLPVNQFSGTHLTMGQYAGAESAQPFKNEKD